MAVQRDGLVDLFKGLLILWVIQIHTVFWSGMLYVSDSVRQISLLIDVSAFFFLSGYLTKPLGLLAAAKKCFRQFKNLYLNYLVLSCLLLVLLGFVNAFKNPAQLDFPLAISSMLLVDPSGGLWEDIYVYPGSLWYLAVYFSLLALVPFVINFFNHRGFRLVFLFSCFLLFSIASTLDWNYKFLFTESIYIYFYLLIYFLGVAYRVDEQNISTRNLKLLFLFNVTLCLLLLFFIKGGTLQLHLNKFPPKLIYLPYSLLPIQIFLIIKRSWNYAAIESKNKALELLEWCGRNTYFIYLLQGFVCSIPGYFLFFFVNKGVPSVVVYCISLIFNLVGTLLLTQIYVLVKSKLLKAELKPAFEKGSR